MAVPLILEPPILVTSSEPITAATSNSTPADRRVSTTLTGQRHRAITQADECPGQFLTAGRCQKTSDHQRGILLADHPGGESIDDETELPTSGGVRRAQDPAGDVGAQLIDDGRRRFDAVADPPGGDQLGGVRAGALLGIGHIIQIRPGPAGIRTRPASRRWRRPRAGCLRSQPDRSELRRTPSRTGRPASPRRRGRADRD